MPADPPRAVDSPDYRRALKSLATLKVAELRHLLLIDLRTIQAAAAVRELEGDIYCEHCSPASPTCCVCGRRELGLYQDATKGTGS